MQVLINSSLGETEQAWTIAEESLTIFREIGDKFGESNIISFLAFLAFGMNQYERAEQLWLELYNRTRAIGNIVGNSLALLNLSVLELAVRKNPVKAEALFLECLTNYRALGLPNLKQRTPIKLVDLYCEQDPSMGVVLWWLLGSTRYPATEGKLSPQVHIRRALGGPIASAIFAVIVTIISFVWLRHLSEATDFLAVWLMLDNWLVFTIGALFPPLNIGIFSNDGGTIWNSLRNK